MSKYTAEELRAKAIAAMRYRGQLPHEYANMCSLMGLYLGVSPREVDRMIQRLANTK